MTELKDIDYKFDKGQVDVETEFYHPAKSLPNNWNEDDWTNRLHVGLKKTFQVDAMQEEEGDFMK